MNETNLENPIDEMPIQLIQIVMPYLDNIQTIIALSMTAKTIRDDTKDSVNLTLSEPKRVLSLLSSATLSQQKQGMLTLIKRNIFNGKEQALASTIYGKMLLVLIIDDIKKLKTFNLEKFVPGEHDGIAPQLINNINLTLAVVDQISDDQISLNGREAENAFRGLITKRAPKYLFNLRGLRLVNVNFQGVISLKNADMADIYFKDGSVNQAHLSGTNLINATFVKTDLHHTTFEGSNLEGANFNGNDLKHSNFKDSNLTNVNFENAILLNVKFINSNLENACLSGANLWGANFSGAKLLDCNIRLAMVLDTLFSTASDEELEKLQFFDDDDFVTANSLQNVLDTYHQNQQNVYGQKKDLDLNLKINQHIAVNLIQQISKIEAPAKRIELLELALKHPFFELGKDKLHKLQENVVKQLEQKNLPTFFSKQIKIFHDKIEPTPSQKLLIEAISEASPEVELKSSVPSN